MYKPGLTGTERAWALAYKREDWSWEKHCESVLVKQDMYSDSCWRYLLKRRKKMCPWLKSVAWKGVGNTIKEDKYLDPNDVYNSRKALNQGLSECASDLNSWDFPSRCVWGLNSTQSCMHGSRWVLDLPGTNKLLFSSVTLNSVNVLTKTSHEQVSCFSVFLGPDKCLALRLNRITVLKSSEVKVIQSCLTLCDPMDYTIHRIL